MFRKTMVVVLLAAVSVSAQEAPTTSARSENAQVLTLEEVLREVREKNPAIHSSERLLEAQRRRVAPAGALPDPTLSLSYMGDAAPFKTQEMDPSSYRGVSAMQMLPLGGKRELRREMARKEVNASEADNTAVIRRLRADARAAYYEYFYYARALEITERNKKRLEQLADISEARYKVGKGMQADVLRAHVEVSMLLQRSVMLTQQRETAAARLNSLMGRPIDAPLGAAVEPLKKEPLPPIASLATAAETNDPMLLKEQSMVERNRVAIAIARKEDVPDLAVGYMYQQRSGMPDMYGMQFSINIPIFYKSKQREVVEQAKLELAAAEKSRESRKLELAYELKQMHAMAVNADRMLELYEKAILPQAELALESAQSSYGVGSADFLTVVSNFSTIHGYQLDYYKQLADYQTALARIEALTGDLSQISKEAK